jgi:16S rRNA processing protein RimM
LREYRSPPAGEASARGARAGAAARILIGIVTGPHGVTGAVRIKSFTARPEDIAAYGALADDTGRRFALRLVGAGKGVLIARLSGVEDRNRAEELRGLRLYLPRAALPPAATDEFYHADLIGLAAVTGDGTALGRVRAVHDFGAGDTLEIERAAAPPAMVPFTRAIVPVVDLAGGRLVIDPPPGLIDKADALTNPPSAPTPNPPPLAGEGREGALDEGERADEREPA